MANALTETDDGLIAYEDFAGQTDTNTATSTDFSFDLGVDALYIVDTVDGQKCVKTNNNTWANDGNGGIYISAEYSSLFAQWDTKHSSTGGWDVFLFSGSAFNLWRAYLTGSTFPRLRASGGSANTNIFDSTSNGDIYPPTTTSPVNSYSVWKTCQELERSNDHMTRWFPDRVTPTHAFRSNIDEFAVPTGVGDKKLCSETRGGDVHYFANLIWMKSNIINFTGLTSGMIINRYDSSGNYVASVKAEATTATMDASLWNCIFAHSGKWEVLGTDGSQLYIDSTNTDVYAGSTHAYSGDTVTASSGGGQISCIGGNIL